MKRTCVECGKSFTCEGTCLVSKKGETCKCGICIRKDSALEKRDLFVCDIRFCAPEKVEIT